MPSSGRRWSVGELWDDVLYQIDKRFPPDRRTVGFTLAILAIGIVGLFTFQALSVRADLNEAADQAEVLKNQIVAGDVEGARVTLTQLQQHAGDAHATSNGLLWKVGSKVPWIGRNFEAVRVVSAELDHVAETAMPPIVELAGQLNAKAFNPEGGRVDISAIEDTQDGIDAAANALTESDAALADIDIASLISPLRGSVASAQQSVRTAAAVSTNADLAAQLLPDMLGGDGTRRYLLMALNNAEVRPTGGIAGSFGVIEAKRGKISLVWTGATSDFTYLEPVVTLTKDEQSVFPSTMASDIRDANTTWDFPRVAEISRKLAERDLGMEIDGVISVDPIALSYVLNGLGSVEVGDTVLHSNNVVSILLHQVNVVFEDRTLQDEYFAQALDAIFEQFSSGAGDPTATLQGIIRSVSENRIAVWSKDKGEQKLIAPTDLSGRWVDDELSPHVGVFLSDAASTKMEYFLSATTSVAAQNCLDRDRQVLSVTTQLTSTAPTSGLPVNVTGDGKYVKKGRMRLNARLVSPTGGHFTSVKVDGESVTVNADSWHDRNVTRVEVVLSPGQTKTITANVTSAEGQAADPVVTLTPGLTSQRNDFTVLSACRD